ncbi:hypothetical protein LTR85_001056 [Meristemomyces frigidus]|nr:hypothetical protein LTR85_001056 [Meristemomyces frigidus]
MSTDGNSALPRLPATIIHRWPPVDEALTHSFTTIVSPQTSFWPTSRDPTLERIRVIPTYATRAAVEENEMPRMGALVPSKIEMSVVRAKPKRSEQDCAHFWSLAVEYSRWAIRKRNRKLLCHTTAGGERAPGTDEGAIERSGVIVARPGEPEFFTEWQLKYETLPAEFKIFAPEKETDGSLKAPDDVVATSRTLLLNLQLISHSR